MNPASSENCICCGMPMRTPEDHAMRDAGKKYCRFCATPDGSMRSYDECLAGIAAFLQRTQGLDEKVARNTATAMMASLPAWSDQKESTSS